MTTGTIEFLKPLINKVNRDYFIEKVNEPLVRAITLLANRYPEPTRINCYHPNTHRLMDMEDKFFEHWDFERARNPVIRALFKMLIVKYEHSPAWRNMLDWAIREIPDDWKPFDTSRQMQCWKGE